MTIFPVEVSSGQWQDTRYKTIAEIQDTNSDRRPQLIQDHSLYKTTAYTMAYNLNTRSQLIQDQDSDTRQQLG